VFDQEEFTKRSAAKMFEGARVTNGAAAQTLKTVSIMAQVAVKSYLFADSAQFDCGCGVNGANCRKLSLPDLD
jgi:hypothetical protein